VGTKLGWEDALFAALAPFAEEGSFVSVVGEDGRIWRAGSWSVASVFAKTVAWSTMRRLVSRYGRPAADNHSLHWPAVRIKILPRLE
jgi:hypothetical protein